MSTLATTCLLSLSLLVAPDGPAGPLSALVDETRLQVTLTPAEGTLFLRADLTLRRTPGGGSHAVTLALDGDLTVLSAEGPTGPVDFRQGGRTLQLFFDPPLGDNPLPLSLTLAGSPRDRAGHPLLTTEGLGLLPGRNWYPAGQGPTLLSLSVDLPPGWTALGSGMALSSDGRPRFAAVPTSGAEGWIVAAPGIAVVAAAAPNRTSTLLVGPERLEPVLKRAAPGLAMDLSRIAAVLGPLPTEPTILLEWPGIERKTGIPGALLLPPGRLRPLVEREPGDLGGLVGLWWGGLVRPVSDGDDPRWMDGLAEGLASLIREASGEPIPARPARLQEAYWTLPAEDRGPLREAQRRDPEAAVIVPAAGILCTFAGFVGEDTFLTAVARATAHLVGQEADLAGFTASLEEAAGLRTGSFFHPWLRRAGPARLWVSWESKPKGHRHEVTLSLQQDGLPVPLAVEVDLYGESRTLRRTLTTDEAVRTVSLELPFKPERVVADPDLRLFRWTPDREDRAARRTAVREATRLAELASNHLERGTIAEARGMLRQALEMDPEHPRARLEMGRLLVQQREMEAARAILLPLARQEAFPEHPGMAWVRPWAEVWVGRAWDVQRDRKQALDAYRRALELPDTRGVHQAANEGIARPYLLRR